MGVDKEEGVCCHNLAGSQEASDEKVKYRHRDTQMSFCQPWKFVIRNRELEAMPERYSQPGKAGTWAANQGHDASSTPSEWHRPSPRSVRSPLFPPPPLLRSCPG
ncbi:uncharacterized [Tachysurus ichikawai]